MTLSSPAQAEQTHFAAQNTQHSAGAQQAIAMLQVITQQEKTQGYTLLKHCPVSGALLSKTDHLGNYVYMLFQMDAGVGKNLQGGTFRTARQVNTLPTAACIACAAHDVRNGYCNRVLPLSFRLGFVGLVCSFDRNKIYLALQANRSWILKMSEWAV